MELNCEIHNSVTANSVVPSFGATNLCKIPFSDMSILKIKHQNKLSLDLPKCHTVF